MIERNVFTGKMQLVNIRPPAVGSKFRGKSMGFADEPNGVFWQVLPPIDKSQENLQFYLLKHAEEQKRREELEAVVNALVLADTLYSNVVSLGAEVKRMIDEPKHIKDKLPTIKRKWSDRPFALFVKEFWKALKS